LPSFTLRRWTYYFAPPEVCMAWLFRLLFRFSVIPTARSVMLLFLGLPGGAGCRAWLVTVRELAVAAWGLESDDGSGADRRRDRRPVEQRNRA